MPRAITQDWHRPDAYRTKYPSLRRMFVPTVSCSHPRHAEYVQVVAGADQWLRNERRRIFDQLVSEWEPIARLASSVHQVALHPAYQSMIGLGPEIVPYIVEQMQADHSPHWFWALRAITRSDPAAGIESVEDAVTAWLNWARRGVGSG